MLAPLSPQIQITSVLSSSPSSSIASMHAADVAVGVLRKPGVDLHLAGVEQLEVLGHVVPGRERLVAWRQLGVRRDDAERLLPSERLLPEPVPALVELALVLVGPLLGT